MPSNFESVHWHEEIDHRSVSPELQGTDWSIRSGTLKGGLSEGVDVVELNNGSLRVSVLPTRGMGIWNARLGNIPVGWKSPVERPVHPAYVNLESRNGLGWLDGFNELICRCGLSFNGPPGTDDGNPSPIESHVTLHGKIANLPASHVVTRVDAKQRLLSVTGVVDESTLFGPNLRLTSSVFTELGSNRFSIRDTISNHGAGPAEVQLLYHTNVGRPFLEEGAEFVCPAEVVVPRDPRAAEDVNSWSSYLAPTAEYAEQVYFFRMAADANGRTLALLRNNAGDRGFCVRYSVKQLPCFSQWKCTQPEAAGYVTGLEPGMNYPNFKSFERHHGRVHKLASGDDITIELDFDVYDSASQVQAAMAEIAELQQSAPRVEPHPTSPFC